MWQMEVLATGYCHWTLYDYIDSLSYGHDQIAQPV